MRRSDAVGQGRARENGRGGIVALDLVAVADDRDELLDRDRREHVLRDHDLGLDLLDHLDRAVAEGALEAARRDYSKAMREVMTLQRTPAAPAEPTRPRAANAA